MLILFATKDTTTLFGMYKYAINLFFLCVTCASATYLWCFYFHELFKRLVFVLKRKMIV